jgi:Ca2+-binding EF-hand superfamily protein
MLMSLISTNHNNEISMEDFVTSMKKYLDRDSEEGISKRKREATYEESRAGVHNKIAKYMLQFEMNSNIDQVYKCFVNNFSRMTDLEEQLDVIINDKSFSDQMKEEVLEDFRKTDLESIAQMLVSSSTLDEEYAALQKCRNALKILTVCASSEERKKIAADIIRIYETFLNMNVVPSLLKSLSRTSDMFVYESLKILCLLIPGPRLDECLPAKHILLYDRKLFKNLIGYSGIPIIAKLIGSNRIKISDKAISALSLLCSHYEEMRDYALEMGALKFLLESFQGIFERRDSATVLYSRIYCLSILLGHRHSSPPDLKWIKQAVPVLSELLSLYGKRFSSIEILSLICRCISLAPGFYVKDIVEKMMNFLQSDDIKIVEIALITIKRQFLSEDQLLVNQFLKFGSDQPDTTNLFVKIISKLIAHNEAIIRSRALELLVIFIELYGQIDITFQTDIISNLYKIIEEDRNNRVLAIRILKFYCRGSMEQVNVLIQNPTVNIIDVICNSLQYFKETDDEIFQKVYGTKVKYNFELCHHALVALNSIISCGDLAEETANPFACKFSVKAINQLASLLEIIRTSPKNEMNAWRYKESPITLEDMVTAVLMKIKIVADRFPNDEDAMQFSNLIITIMKSQYEQDIFSSEAMQNIIEIMYEQYILDHNEMMERVNNVAYSSKSQYSTPGVSTLHNWTVDLNHAVNLLSTAHSELSLEKPKVSWEDFVQLGNWWLQNLSNKKMNIMQFREVVAKMFNITDPVVQKDLFLRMDVDGDRNIDFREFSIGILHLFRQASEEDRMKMMFTLYDDDRNGYISVDEVYAIQEYVLRAKGQEVNEESLKKEVLQRFKAADENNDGRIDFNEFKHAQQSKLIASLF